MFVFLPLRAEAQPFTFTYVENNVRNLNYAEASFADVDGDGDMDLVTAGNEAGGPPFAPVASIFLNVGIAPTTGTDGLSLERHVFDERPLGPAVWHSSIAWTDFDLDGAPDLLLAGATNQEPPFEAVSLLYRNVGGGTFEAVDAGLVGVYGGAAAWADYDNDGDEDLLLMGVTATGGYKTALYRNDGDGSFTEVPSSLPDLAFGSVDWGDYDGDGDSDLLIMGADRTGALLTRVYRNDGDGTFADAGAGLPGLAFGTVAWGDFDNDGNLDILISGGRITERFLEGATHVYHNDGGRFVRMDVPFPGVAYGAAAWVDYDGDGLLDVLLTGEEVLGGPAVARIYRNRGQGTFEHVINFPGAAIASVSWGDYDADHDLDLVVTGTDDDGRPLTNLYRNDRYNVKTPPIPPDGLTAAVDGSTVTLSWNVGSAAEMHGAGLSYALRVGTQPGGTDVVAPLADPISGHRFVSARGATSAGRRRLLKNLSRGHYYWSVQSIDHDLTGSAFAEEGVFSIETDRLTTNAEGGAEALPVRFGLQQNYPNPFNASTTIRYEVPAEADVELKIFNILGQEVCLLQRGVQAAGRHEATWDGSDDTGRPLGAGIYFARLRSRAGSWSAKLVRVE